MLLYFYIVHATVAFMTTLSDIMMNRMFEVNSLPHKKFILFDTVASTSQHLGLKLQFTVNPCNNDAISQAMM